MEVFNKKIYDQKGYFVFKNVLPKKLLLNFEKDKKKLFNQNSYNKKFNNIDKIFLANYKKK